MDTSAPGATPADACRDEGRVAPSPSGSTGARAGRSPRGRPHARATPYRGPRRTCHAGDQRADVSRCRRAGGGPRGRMSRSICRDDRRVDHHAEVRPRGRPTDRRVVPTEPNSSQRSPLPSPLASAGTISLTLTRLGRSAEPSAPPGSRGRSRQRQRAGEGPI